jgi:signal transduction histidine kinase
MRRQAVFVAGLVLSVIAAALAVATVLQPAREDIPLFAALFAVPLAAAVAAAAITRRRAWWRRFRSVAAALFIAYAMGAGLILLTVFVTARLMFISAHDATLSVVIVAFATGVAVVLGYVVATSLGEGIAGIARAARAVRDGDLNARVDETGSDELASLARAFNDMTGQLRRAREQEARLNQARREWVAWVSHDLRTPLTSARARIEALADGVVADPAEVDAYLAAARTDVDALSRLIDDLFELAVIDAGGLRLDVTAFSLGDLASDTLEAMRVLADRRGIALRGAVSPDVDPVRLSPPHIQRVLNNLVANALAHTRDGGSVTLSVTRERSPDQVCVRVADTGEGIPLEDLPRVFERFYRGERSRARAAEGGATASGMGLGLAIAKALVEAHGGAIGIESRVAHGTTVWFTLPQ